MYDYVDQRVTSLDHGGRFLIWSMRSWVHALAKSKCPPSAIGPAFAKWNIIGALPQFHMAMMILNRDGLEMLRFGPLHCHRVSEDEALLLNLLRTLRRDNPEVVRDTLALMINEDSVGSLFVALTALALRLADAGLIPEAPARRRSQGAIGQ
jgi:hypothetical protein